MTVTPDRSSTTALGALPSQTGALARSDGGSLAQPTSHATFTGFKCGSCGSEDIQKLSVVYETGTSNIDARTTGSSTGLGIGRGGLGVGTAFNSSRTRGTQTTELAKRAAPPKRKAGAGWIVAGIIGALIATAFTGIIGFILVPALCAYLAYQGSR